MWNGRRVISESWVEASIQPQGSIHAPDDYGYAWWIRTYAHAGRDVTACYAGGNGGQYTIIIPDLDMVIQFCAGNYSDRRNIARPRDELVPEYILPAVID